jgi:hypothetical protein
MRYEFTVTKLHACESDDGALVCGLGGERDQLAIWRVLRGANADGLVYAELVGSENHGRGHVCAYRLGDSYLSIDLSKPIGHLSDVEGLDINLSIDAESQRGLPFVLSTIFEGAVGISDA